MFRQYTFLLIFVFSSIVLFSQEEDKTRSRFYVEPNLNASVNTRTLWRGLNFGQSPALHADMSISRGIITFGTFFTQTLNGRVEGYGNSREVYLAVQPHEQIVIVFDDYFFTNGNQSYFDYDDHYPELRVEYTNGSIGCNIGYDIKDWGIWIEPSYAIDEWKFYVGFLTMESTLNFHSRGGFNLIGVDYQRKLSEYFDIRATLHANPNYKNITSEAYVPNSPLNGNVSIIWIF